VLGKAHRIELHSMVWSSHPGPNHGRAAEGDNSKLRVTEVGRRRYAFPSRRAALVEHYTSTGEPEPSAVAARGARSPPCNADSDFLPLPENSKLRVTGGQGGANVNFNRNYSPELDFATSIERAILNRSSRLSANWPDLFHPAEPASGDTYTEPTRLLNYGNYMMRLGPSLPDRYRRISPPTAAFAGHSHQQQPSLHRTSLGWSSSSQPLEEGAACDAALQAAAVSSNVQPLLEGERPMPSAEANVLPEGVNLMDASCQTVSHVSTQAGAGDGQEQEEFEERVIEVFLPPRQSRATSASPPSAIKEGLAVRELPSSGSVVAADPKSICVLRVPSAPAVTSKQRPRASVDRRRGHAGLPSRASKKNGGEGTQQPAGSAPAETQAGRRPSKVESGPPVAAEAAGRVKKAGGRRGAKAASVPRRRKVSATHVQQAEVAVQAGSPAAGVLHGHRRRPAAKTASSSNTKLRFEWQAETDKVLGRRQQQLAGLQSPAPKHSGQTISSRATPSTVEAVKTTRAPRAAVRKSRKDAKVKAAFPEYAKLLGAGSDSSSSDDGGGPSSQGSRQDGHGQDERRESVESLSDLERLIEEQHRELVSKGVLPADEEEEESEADAVDKELEELADMFMQEAVFDSFLGSSTAWEEYNPEKASTAVDPAQASAHDAPSQTETQSHAARSQEEGQTQEESQEEPAEPSEAACSPPPAPPPVDTTKDSEATLTPVSMGNQEELQEIPQEVDAGVQRSGVQHSSKLTDIRATVGTVADWLNSAEEAEDLPRQTSENGSGGPEEMETQLPEGSNNNTVGSSFAADPPLQPQASRPADSRNSWDSLPSLGELRASIEEELERARRVLESTAHLSRPRPADGGPPASVAPQPPLAPIATRPPVGASVPQEPEDEELQGSGSSSDSGSGLMQLGKADRSPSLRLGRTSSGRSELDVPRPSAPTPTKMAGLSSEFEFFNQSETRDDEDNSSGSDSNGGGDKALSNGSNDSGLGLGGVALLMGGGAHPAAPQRADSPTGLARNGRDGQAAASSNYIMRLMSGYDDIDDIPTPEGSSVIDTEVSESDAEDGALFALQFSAR